MWPFETLVPIPPSGPTDQSIFLCCSLPRKKPPELKDSYSGPGPKSYFSCLDTLFLQPCAWAVTSRPLVIVGQWSVGVHKLLALCCILDIAQPGRVAATCVGQALLLLLKLWQLGREG